MEAFRTLMAGGLAPTGNPIAIKSSADFRDPQLVSGFHASYVDSGTSALALALIDCRNRRPDTLRPKVIIPGYCCPDLVSAAVFAGLQPLAVDICKDGAGYDLDQLQCALSEEVIAVVAVNFLGVADNLEVVKGLVDASGASLVEDNAQWLPMDAYQSCADYVVFSFGRGKPMSLLGGGVLYHRTELHQPYSFADVGPVRKWVLLLKLQAYNILLHPRCYGFITNVGVLKLGQTVYKPKLWLAQMDAVRVSLLAANVARYKQYSQGFERKLLQLFSNHGVGSCVAIGASAKRLLRFPVLCESKDARDALLLQLNQQGLGVSIMYGSAIDRVEGVAGKLEVFGALSNAQQFSNRLLTLPVHSHVNEVFAQKILTFFLDRNNESTPVPL